VQMQEIRTSGWVVFAAVLMMMAGMFGMINGLIALLKDEVYVVGPERLVVFDFTQWGWIHLIHPRSGGVLRGAGGPERGAVGEISRRPAGGHARDLADRLDRSLSVLGAHHHRPRSIPGGLEKERLTGLAH